MSDLDEMEEKIMTPEGIAQYAQALISVQRKEQQPLMDELKASQEYSSCDDDAKELFGQIISGYPVTSDDCLPELDECYMQLTIKKGEAGPGFSLSCAFCRERQGKSYGFNLSPADYFMIIQLVGIYKPGVVHSFAPYYFFTDDIVALVDEILKNKMQERVARKKIKVIR